MRIPTPPSEIPEAPARRDPAWATATSAMVNILRVLGVICFYVLILISCSLAITLLQIRQETGPLFDTMVKKLVVHGERAKSEAGAADNLVRLDSLRAKPSAEQAEAGWTKEFDYWNGSFNGFQQEAKGLQEVEDELTRRLNDVEKDPAKLALATDRVSGISEFLNSFQLVWMMKMPSDFLVLFLATMMGALGGTLSTMRKLVQEGEQPSWPDYLLRPALGFIVAMAVFTLFKAGQLVISNNAANTSGESLNPFLVAFIGMISGLVAKQAIARIEAAGTSFFAARDDRQPVYARELLSQKLSAAPPAEVAMLISMLGITRQELDSWQTEQSPIPSRAAEIISAFLHIEGRNLFATDARAKQAIL